MAPDPAVAGQTVTIEYDESGRPIAGAASVRLHYGFDNWSTVISPDPAMSDADNDGVWTISPSLSPSATTLDMVFNDGNNNWDNNAGADWHFTVTGSDPNAGFEIDGSLDAEAQLIASHGGVNLWAALDGDTLYLASTPAAGGNDRFIVLAETPAAMQNAMWAKSGQVAAWDAFVGNEESNGYNGWFDATGAAQVAQGSVLECTIDLAGEFGSVPGSVYAAVLSYTTADGGALVPSLQVPASTDNDGNAEAAEFIEIPPARSAASSLPGRPRRQRHPQPRRRQPRHRLRLGRPARRPRRQRLAQPLTTSTSSRPSSSPGAFSEHHRRGFVAFPSLPWRFPLTSGL
ncbi:MAG: carbohydrate-binding protein [Phycisphaerales bacterium]